MSKSKSSEEKEKSKVTMKTALDDLKGAGLVILGVAGGALAGQVIDKILKVDDTATEFQLKAIAKPIVQIVAGVSGAIFLKNKNLKLIASGVAASGVITGVKVFLKKDILNGLGDFNIADPVKRVFRDPINLAIAPYNPELPVLNENREEIQIESAPTNMGDLDDYEEIQEVQIL
ncbi:MAG: hypothetical protein HY840_09825 [Bacteroidetes bacterium]|nr:hypothetical protein [Bacteroidota bacterium]